MTKKDYERIAAVARDWLVEQPGRLPASPKQFLMRLADALAADNPRFDRARFLRACGCYAATETTR